MKNLINLCFLSKKNEPPATFINNVSLEGLSDALLEVYNYGGFLYLMSDNIDGQYIKELHFLSNPREFRIIALTRDNDKKRELLEWWNPLKKEYNGEVKFLDEMYDSRMVSADLEVGKCIFFEFLEKKDLKTINLIDFRSQWDPLPH